MRGRVGPRLTRGVTAFFSRRAADLSPAPPGAPRSCIVRPMLRARLFASVLLILPLLDLGCRAAPESKAPLFQRQLSTAEAPAETLAFSVHYTFAADGTYTRQERHRYRLLTDSGVRAWGVISGVWEPWYQERPVLEATVTTPDGAEVKLDPTTISAGPAHEWSDQVFSDSQVLRAPLPALTVGAVVEEVVTVRTAKSLPWPQVHREMLQGPVKRGAVEIVIDAPEGMKIHHEVDGLPQKASEQLAGGRRRITWKATDLAALEVPESDLPLEVRYWPRLVFTTHGQTWRDVARTYAGFVDESLKGFEVPAGARAIVDARASREQKIAGLLEWVHDRVRYTGLELGTGTVLPSAPATVLSRGYGDCKDQATMLVGLLRAAGIEAHVALLRAGSREDITPGFPGISEFNHAIVHVPGKTPVWIDPTSEFSRAGELPGGDQGRHALIAASDTQAPVLTPRATADDNLYVETRTVTLAELGKASVHEEISATGEMELGLRGSLNGTRKELTEGLASYAKSEYVGAEVKTFDMTPAADLASKYRFQIQVDKSGVGETNLAHAAVTLGWGPLFRSLPGGIFKPSDEDEDKLRKSPLRVETPYDARLHYRIKAPAGFELLAPEFVPVDLGPVLLERSATREGDDLLVSFRVRLAADQLTPEQVNLFRERVEVLDKQDAMRVVAVHRASLAYDKKDIAGALAIVAAEAKSGRATGRLRHADVLSNVHLRDQALAELRALIAAEPSNATAHTMLGDILRADRYGRTFARGWDRAGSTAAYLKAAELDEELKAVKIHAANNQENGDFGTELGAGSDLARAAEIWETIDPEVVAGFQEGALVNNELFVLWHLQRYDAIEKHLAERGAGAPAIGKLMLTWKRSGISGMLAELRSAPAFKTQGERTQAMAVMLGLLTPYESYGNLAALADSAGSMGMGDDRQIDLIRAMMRAAEKAQSVTAAATGPKKIFVALMDATTLPTPDAVEKSTEALLSKRVTKPEHVLQALSSWRKHTRKGPMPAVARFTRDTVVGAATVTSQGSDAVGHRVSVSLTLGSSTDAPVHLYVVREGDGYKLRATQSARAELLREALHLLSAGQAKAARQWLEWYFEGMRKTDDHVLTQRPEVLLWAEGKAQDLALVASVALAAYYDHDALKAVVAARAKLGDADPNAPVLDTAIVLYATEKSDAAATRRAFTGLQARYAGVDALAEVELQLASHTKDWARFDKLVPAYLTRWPKAHWLKRKWASTFAERGQIPRALELLVELQAQGEADDSDFNNMAWWSLFVGEGVPGERELQWALRAGSTDNVSRVHTLGCVYAAMGRTALALETFDRLARLETEIDLDDEFLLAEIHRQLGYTAEAREIYARVAKQEGDDPTSTAALARRRLARKGR